MKLKTELRSLLLTIMEQSSTTDSGEVPLAYAEDELRAWFDPLEIRVGEAKDRDILILFPHIFFSEWFAPRGRRWLEIAMGQLVGQDVILHYEVAKKTLSHALSEHFAPSKHPQNQDTTNFSRPVESFVESTPSKTKKGSQEKAVAPSGFDTFFAGGKNQFALSIIKEMGGGRVTYNPLFLKGSSGTGKTHLLHALAAALTDRLSASSFDETLMGATASSASLFPDIKNTRKGVQCLSASDFASFFRQPAARRDYIRSSLRASAGLCIDDIHQLAGQAQAQEELAALIDSMISLGRPVICTSSMPSPSTISSQKMDVSEELSPSLLARLSMGMVLELAEPDLDVRLQYAQSQLAEKGLQTGREVPLLLARRCADLRHLRGVILRMAAFRSHTGRWPDDNDMDTILHASGSPYALTPEAILALVAAHCGFVSKDLRGRKRDPRLVQVRQIAMYLCRELLGESYPSLGRIFGGKDHSTIMYAVKKIREIQVTNKDVHTLVTELTQSCRKHLL